MTTSADSCANQATYSMIVSQILARAMKARGLNQKDFLTESAISQSTWSRINRGLADFDLADLRNGCRVLGLSIDEVLAEAEDLFGKLPDEGVDVVDTATKNRARTVAGAAIAAAALGFLIARLMK